METLPESMTHSYPMRTYQWTPEQWLGYIAEHFPYMDDGLDVVAHVADEFGQPPSTDAVDYMLEQVAEIRRKLLVLKNDQTATCRHCDTPFTPIRSTATYCCDACRQAAYRART